MKIDLHTHTVYGSGCSHIDPSDLIRQAKHVGLNGICITEHNQLWEPERIEKLCQKHDFLVIGGVEVLTEYGEVLVFGLHEPVRWVRHTEELRNMVDRVGGFMIAAHPFRNQPIFMGSIVRSADNMDIEDGCKLPLLRYVDALEAYNGWAYRQEWAYTLAVGQRLGLKGTGGSDAHKLLQTGLCYTLFERPIKNEGDFLAELKAGRFAPANCYYGTSPMP